MIARCKCAIATSISVALCVSHRWTLIALALCMLNTMVFATPGKSLEGKSDFTPRIALTTILPGRSLYSAFGHSSIRVTFPNDGPDWSYNYGLSARPFDTRFLLGMLTGQMPFMVAKLRTADMYAFYDEVEKRKIIEQEIFLSPKDSSILIEALEQGTQPGNNSYNYRYFSNNCATKIWEQLSSFLSQSALAQDEGQKATIRDYLDKELSLRPGLRLVVNLFLGPKADLPASFTVPFLPRLMMDRIAASSQIDRPLPLIGASLIINKPAESVQSAFQYGPLLLCLGLALGSTALLTWGQSRFALIFDGILFFAAVGTGLVICLFWLAAGYLETGWNANLLWANPFGLIAVVAFPNGLHRKRAQRLLLILGGGLSLLFVLFGGFGAQRIDPELRLFALAVLMGYMRRLAMFHPWHLAASRRITTS